MVPTTAISVDKNLRRENLAGGEGLWDSWMEHILGCFGGFDGTFSREETRILGKQEPERNAGSGFPKDIANFEDSSVIFVKKVGDNLGKIDINPHVALQKREKYWEFF